MRDSAIQPTMPDSRRWGSRYCMPMKARSPRPMPLMWRPSSRLDDAAVVARDQAGLVRRVEERGEAPLGIDEEDRGRVVDGVAAVRSTRPDDGSDAECARQGLDVRGIAGQAGERRV